MIFFSVRKKLVISKTKVKYVVFDFYIIYPKKLFLYLDFKRKTNINVDLSSLETIKFK